MVEELIVAVIGISHIRGRHTDTTTYCQHKHSTNNGHNAGESYSMSARSKPAWRDRGHQQRKQRSIHYYLKHLDCDIATRHTCKRIFGRIEVEKHCRIEFELPERIQREVGHKCKRHRNSDNDKIWQENCPERHLWPPCRYYRRQQRQCHQVSSHRYIQR